MKPFHPELLDCYILCFKCQRLTSKVNQKHLDLIQRWSIKSFSHLTLSSWLLSTITSPSRHLFGLSQAEWNMLSLFSQSVPTEFQSFPSLQKKRLKLLVFSMKLNQQFFLATKFIIVTSGQVNVDIWCHHAVFSARFFRSGLTLIFF